MTSDDLSKKKQCKYFLRTVPWYLQVCTIKELYFHYHWSYVKSVYSENIYNDNGFKNVHSQISGLNSLVAAENNELAKSATLHDNDNEISEILSKIIKVEATILFYNWGKMMPLLEVADRINDACKIMRPVTIQHHLSLTDKS